MARKTYQDYLASPQWKSRRNQVVRKKKVCELCGSSDHLNVHHKYYSNGTQKNILGNEPNYLLTLLCEDCHHLWHSMWGHVKLRKAKIKNIRLHLANGFTKEQAFINCNRTPRKAVRNVIFRPGVKCQGVGSQKSLTAKT